MKICRTTFLVFFIWSPGDGGTGNDDDSEIGATSTNRQHNFQGFTHQDGSARRTSTSTISYHSLTSGNDVTPEDKADEKNPAIIEQASVKGTGGENNGSEVTAAREQGSNVASYSIGTTNWRRPLSSTVKEMGESAETLVEHEPGSESSPTKLQGLGASYGDYETIISDKEGPVALVGSYILEFLSSTLEVMLNALQSSNPAPGTEPCRPEPPCRQEAAGPGLPVLGPKRQDWRCRFFDGTPRPCRLTGGPAWIYNVSQGACYRSPSHCYAGFDTWSGCFRTCILDGTAASDLVPAETAGSNRVGPRLPKGTERDMLLSEVAAKRTEEALPTVEDCGHYDGLTDPSSCCQGGKIPSGGGYVYNVTMGRCNWYGGACCHTFRSFSDCCR